jgi:hypothetical protein
MLWQIPREMTAQINTVWPIVMTAVRSTYHVVRAIAQQAAEVITDTTD